MESCYPGVYDLYRNEPKESSKAAQTKESSSKTSRLFGINESKSDRFPHNGENSKENQEEITHVLRISSKKFLFENTI